MKCKICNKEAELKFSHKVLRKYDVKYYYCQECSFLFTEEPYWLEESYKSPINVIDTGILDRNLYFGKVVSSIIFFFFNKGESFLDYAGGYGIFTRLMRDYGYDFYWSDKYSDNVMARGFEFDTSAHKEIEAITVFEVFEHLFDPIDEIEKMLTLSNNVFFSTTLLPGSFPEPNDWWYYGFNHGQHISFYSRKTLEIIAHRFDLNFYSYGEMHLFTKKKINRIVFSMLVKLSKYGVAAIVNSLFMKSKTWDDHQFLDQNSQ
jgi:Methyltransferase domain